LVEAELLYQRGRPPRARYIFKHALIQDAAYASLLRSTRQQVHQQIVPLLETRFPELVDTQPELLAHHCTEAGQDEAAINYWQMAGQRAIQGSACIEAIAHLTQGLALLTTLPETPARLQQELDLQVALGPALIANKGYTVPDVERVYTRARELCERVGDTPQLFSVMRGLMVHYQLKGQLQTANQLGDQLLSLAQSRPEPALLLLAHYQLGAVLFFRGEPARAQKHLTQALANHIPQEQRDLALRYDLDIGVGIYGWLSWDLWQLGYPDQALQHCESALSLVQEVSHPYSLTVVHYWAAVLHQFRYEATVVHEQAAALTSLATEHEFASLLSWGQILQGWSLTMQGQKENGIAKLRQGLDSDLATGSKSFQPHFLALLAEAYAEDGYPEEGLNALTEALTVMEDTGARFYGAELYRLKGELLLQQAVPDGFQAETCFHQALDIARSQQAKSLELRAATSLARLWQSQDKRQEAYDLLAPVYEWFTEGFDTADLKEAKALLNELAEDQS
jgi:predicted ATPase